MKTLCEMFRYEAGQIWKQMGECRKLGLGLSEETITEVSLYGIARNTQTSQIAVYPATKPQESKHGADWEWWFTRGGRGFGFRVQAKRLFWTGRYESLFKANQRFDQLNKLVSEAKKDGLFPIYSFYNFDHPLHLFGASSSCQHSFRGPSYWGGSIVLPADIQFLNSDHITDLFPAMVPWHCLVCDWKEEDLPSMVRLSAKRLAAPKRMGQEMRLRPTVEFDAKIVDLPEYVGRLIQLGRTRREIGSERDFLDYEYWSDVRLREREIAGIVTFDDQRSLDSFE